MASVKTRRLPNNGLHARIVPTAKQKVNRQDNRPFIEEQLEITPTVPRCPSGRKSCRNMAKLPHQCPYKEEVNDDCATLCGCCEACQRECSDEI